MELVFKSDTRHRKQRFTSISFSHPAKLMLPLQIWLIEHYSKVGDTILDPMGGSGTILIACSLGRNVIYVELESKFCSMAQDNWTKVQTLGPEMGYEMGTATILQGDARKLPGVLADVVISSPPYEATVSDNKEGPGAGGNEKNYGRWAKGTAKKISYSQDESCKADVIMTSPPYAEAQEGGGIAKKGYRGPKHGPTDLVGKRSYMPEQAGQSDGQISALPYGNIDCVITSPPYEEGGGHGGKATKCALEHKQPSMGQFTENLYSSRPDNIGNLKGESYLSAMLEVYQGCCRALRPQGLMILVTKNFIREKQEIRLDLDTIKLCEQAGFQFVERHYRKLTSQSFWRTIYRQKYPDAPVLNKEDILVFKAT